MPIFVPDCIACFLDQFLGRTSSSRRSIDHLAPWMNEVVDPYLLALRSIGSDTWMQN